MDNKHCYAGFWIRVLAMTVDTFIVMLASGLINVALGLRFYETSTPHGMASREIFAVLMTLAFCFLYFSIFQALLNGTPGKKVFGLMLLDAKRYSQISIGQAVGRFFIGNISALALYVGYIWVGLNPRKQGWHDLAAGTVVVKRKHVEELKLEVGIFPINKKVAKAA